MLAIRPAPAIEDGEGRVVTATFSHYADNLLKVELAETGEILRATANHPFFSEDRATYVPAAQLKKGERLRLHDGGTTQIQKITPLPGLHPVFNIEVEGEHRYFVGEDGVLVHNALTVGGALLRARRIVGHSAVRRIIQKFRNNPRSRFYRAVPNPYGRAGGPKHQAGIAAAERSIVARGFVAEREVRVPTVGGKKSVRYMDVVARDPKTNKIVEIHQVGRSLKSNPLIPVSRERAALRDVRQSPMVRRAKRYFHRY